MLKYRFDFVLILLVVVFAILISLDGFSQRDASMTLLMFGFSALIKLFTGIEDINGAIVWSRRRRSHVLRLLFGIGSITLLVAWRFIAGQASLLMTLEIIFSAAFFFTTCTVLGLWLIDKITNRFNRSK